MGTVINVKSQDTFSLEDSVFYEAASLTSYRIKFEFDKAVIKQESFEFLDSMVSFLNRNKSIHLDVQNHTDSRAQPKYSTNITQRRAQAVVSYLVSKGIEKDRLIPKGYFNKKLLISEVEIKAMKSKTDQELAHQKNRRTVFVIIKV